MIALPLDHLLILGFGIRSISGDSALVGWNLWKIPSLALRVPLGSLVPATCSEGMNLRSKFGLPRPMCSREVQRGVSLIYETHMHVCLPSAKLDEI